MAYTTIDDPTDYFNTILYAGTGSSQSISVGFQTDWTWIKDRDSTENHNIFDTIRTATKRISSNRSNAEDTQAQQLTAFGSNGFTVGTDSGANHSGRNYTSWNWLAGGSASSNTNGSINSSVSVNTTAGFSICSWTHDGGNSTIGHGLGAIPQVVITKERNAVGSWNSYFSGIGNAHRIVLQGTNAKISSSLWNSTTPTANVFSMNDSITSNMIAYCFTEKKGYSKFGTYTGNGNADGSYIHLGFRPAFTILKKSSSSGNRWVINDSKRSPSNVVNKSLFADFNSADSTTSQEIDYLSNGFKLRTTSSNHNTSGHTYIYMAFAESPFTNSNGVPCNAR